MRRSRLIVAVGGIAVTFIVAVYVAAWQKNPRSPRFHAVELPRFGGTKAESRLLLDTDSLELEAVVVPRGTSMTTHTDSAQVTLQPLSGSGVVRMGDVEEAIDPRHVLVLAPGVTHEIEAESDDDLVLLMHNVKVGERRGLARSLAVQAPSGGRCSACPRGECPCL